MNDKTQHDTDDALAKAIVDRLSTDVDPDVAARLRAARQEAVYLVDSAHRKRAPWLAPAGGLVAASVVAVVLLRDPGMQPMPALDETEMAAAAELELLEELEMLAWLDEEMLDAG
ncbi:MAG: hypothetical protein AAF545_04885 [Pseudomonadota bacterium]